MEKGLNSNISYEGESFHIQTEDWGVSNPYVVSRVYRSGAVIKSIKTSYQSIFFHFGESSVESIRVAVREQHQEILDQLLSGQLV